MRVGAHEWAAAQSNIEEVRHEHLDRVGNREWERLTGSAVFTIATRGGKQRDYCGQLRDLANRGTADEF
jgi:hypothetical protein